MVPIYWVALTVILLVIVWGTWKRHFGLPHSSSELANSQSITTKEVQPCVPVATTQRNFHCPPHAKAMTPLRRLTLGLPIDINQTPSHELALLPGVGTTLAERMVAARPFKTLQDVLHVEGIGPNVLQKLEPFVCISEN